MTTKYIALSWPDYQEYMEETWFKCDSYYDANEDVYLIPEHRIKTTKKVFKIEPKALYTSGCAIVIADNALDAENTYRCDEYADYIFDEANCKIIELHELHTDITKSKVIFSQIFID